MRPALLASLLLLAAASRPAVAAAPPFVGCAADGQMGAMTAPAGRAPDLPLPQASLARLAWYQGQAHDAVLGPAGWHCFELYGSNGWSLYVTPTPSDTASLAHGIAGPAIQLTRDEGGTSGRFEAAAIAHGLFPQADTFVHRVQAEKLEKPAFFTSRVAATDQVEHHGADTVFYVTEPNTTGLGTESRLLPSPLPIEGAVMLLPADEMSVMHLAIRLPPDLADLAAAIAGDTAGRYADRASPQGPHH